MLLRVWEKQWSQQLKGSKTAADRYKAKAVSPGSNGWKIKEDACWPQRHPGRSAGSDPFKAGRGWLDKL